jgi:predicted regulator of Ras-like GTPase activity (Roadblock/LC7/MglB family)
MQAPPTKPAQKPPAKPSGQQGLFGNIDDDGINKIFDKLGVKDGQPAGGQTPSQQVPKINVRDAVSTVVNAAVGSGAVPAPKIEGISKLSATAGNEQDTGSGKIASIGKFILDNQDQEQLGKLTQKDLAESKVRVLTMEAADEIYKLLNHIATLPGVIGSCIVGHDGLPVANNLPQEYDPEFVGAMSLGIYVNTTNTIMKMSHSHLHQMVARTQYGFLIIADFGGGILVTVSNAQATEQLIPLMRNITQLVAQ